MRNAPGAVGGSSPACACLPQGWVDTSCRPVSSHGLQALQSCGTRPSPAAEPPAAAAAS